MPVALALAAIVIGLVLNIHCRTGAGTRAYPGKGTGMMTAMHVRLPRTMTLPYGQHGTGIVK